MPNAFGVTRNQTLDDVLPLLRDLAKFANNIGVEFAGPSSNAVRQGDTEALRAIFERFNITSPRIADAIASIEEGP